MLIVVIDLKKTNRAEPFVLVSQDTPEDAGIMFKNITVKERILSLVRNHEKM